MIFKPRWIFKGILALILIPPTLVIVITYFTVWNGIVRIKQYYKYRKKRR
jgi:hypothetical protein